MFQIKNQSDKKAIEEMILEREDILKKLLPEGTVAPLYESKDCLFCAGLDAGQRDCFAITDLGHEEPKSMKQTAIGISVKSKVGTILPVEISCCSRCKGNHQTANAIPAVTMVLTILIGLVFFGISPYNNWLTKVSGGLSVIFFVILLPIGYLAGNMLKISFINRNSSRTIFDIFEIPLLHRLKLAGWFPVFGRNNEAKLIFSKHRLKRNRTPQESEIKHDNNI